MAREPRSRKRCSWHLRKRERGYFKTRSAGVLNAPERTLSNPHIHRHSLPRLRGVRSLKEAPGTTALAPDRGRRRSPVSRQLHLCRTWKWPRVWSVNMHRAGRPSRRGRSGGAIVMARGCCVRAPGAEDARTLQSPATDRSKTPNSLRKPFPGA